jgi:hypothetical protein
LKSFLIDDASSIKFKVNQDFIDPIKSLKTAAANGKNIGIQKSMKLGIDNLLFTDHDCILDKE